jgi:hypothetical protein
MVTVAPDTTAPDLSVIVPRMVEAPNWPQTQVLDAKRMITRADKLNLIVDHLIDGSFRATHAIKNFKPAYKDKLKSMMQ